MTTRSELRAQKTEQEQPDFEGKTTKEAPAKPKHHFGFQIWGTIFLTLVALMLLIDTTLLNKNFAKHEIENSALESVVLDQVNSSLTRYGIPTSVLQKKDTDKIIDQAVDQIYSGEKINLDLSPVISNVDTSVNNELSQYGVSTSVLPGGSAASITGNINSAVNSQLNTSVVAEVTTGIKVAKVIVNVILLVCLAMLVIMVLKALWQHHLFASFSWISLLALVLFNLIISGLKAFLVQVGAQAPDISPFISQVTEDFQQRGMVYSFLLAGLAVILFGVRIIRRIWRPNH